VREDACFISRGGGMVRKLMEGRGCKA